MFACEEEVDGELTGTNQSQDFLMRNPCLKAMKDKLA